MQLGGPWSFYREFWKAHGLTQLNGLLPDVGVNVFPGERIQIPVLIDNGSDSEVTVTVRADAPSAWTEVTGSGAYLIPAHQSIEFYVKAKTSAGPATGPATGPANSPQNLVLNADVPVETIQPITISVHPDRAALPQ
jgi:hypothetical protein